jgi:hypothetical protein
MAFQCIARCSNSAAECAKPQFIHSTKYHGVAARGNADGNGFWGCAVMSDILQAARPVAPAPNVANIPAELIARVQWVCWWYEQDKNGKWTKPLIIPGTKSNASHSNRKHWRSFPEAYAAYMQSPTSAGGIYDGIGYVFSKDDPHVGGDIDHSLDMERVPLTYAEISPSGNGIKFIAKGTIAKGRKTAKGELYSKQRFFTITGNVLPGHETITECQAAVEAFAASLGSDKGSKAVSEGTAGCGSRAELAASHSEHEYEEGRRLLRTSIDFQVRCLTNSAKEGTQLAYLLAGDYAGFHHKWPAVGLYRADGSLDDSQVRAVMARSIYGRGFTFPRYCALMSHYFAAQALAKWGTKQAWREELAALWQYAIDHTGYAPRSIAPKPQAKRPRGRANIHAATVEQVYGLLLEHRAGTDAIIHIADLAAAIGVHRRTVTSILDELRAAERITTKRLAGGAGLLVTFEPKRDVIIPVETEAELPAPARVNNVAPAYAEETREKAPVFLQDRAEADHISEPPTLAELAKNYLDQPASAVGEQVVNKKTGAIHCRAPRVVRADGDEDADALWERVYQRAAAPADDAAELQGIAALVSAAECPATGGFEVRLEPIYRRTAKHFAALVTAEYPYTAEQAIEAYKAEQQRRKDEAAREWALFFARLRTMTNDELIAYVGSGCRREVSELAHAGGSRDLDELRPNGFKGITEPVAEKLPFDKHLYATRLKCARQHLGWRGLTMPKRTTKIQAAADDALLDAQADWAAAVIRPEPVRPFVQFDVEELPANLPSVVDVGALVARSAAKREAAHV